MNLKNILVILTGSMFYINSVQGQYIPTVEEGKKWTIELSYGLGSFHYSNFTIACDTFLQQKNYYGIYDDAHNLVGLIREDTLEQEVYFLDLNSQNEVLFLKYNVEAGDTVDLNGNDLIVSDVRYDSLFGQVRKVIVINDLLAWIEGAGTSRYGIIKDYPFPHPWPSLIDLQPTQDLCETITSTLISTDYQKVTIYPNPFKDYIDISSQYYFNFKYRIIDLSGKTILNGNCEPGDQIDTEALSPGMYLILINGEAKKMIKL